MAIKRLCFQQLQKKKKVMMNIEEIKSSFKLLNERDILIKEILICIIITYSMFTMNKTFRLLSVMGYYLTTRIIKL